MTRATALRERPILFSPEMVRAILDGRKTQTRRVVRPQPIPDPNARDWFPWSWYGGGRKAVAACKDAESFAYWLREWCPYGQPGDWLWVRETWAPMCREADPYCWCETEEQRKRNHYIEYRADTGNPRPGDWPADIPAGEGVPRWRPSIHMPRWASRITLEITDVRVERVQDITDADCYAEGLPADEPSAFEDAEMAQAAGLHIPEGSAERHWFRVGWDRLNARRGYGWETNPWVWALTFRRVR